MFTTMMLDGPPVSRKASKLLDKALKTERKYVERRLRKAERERRKYWQERAKTDQSRPMDECASVSVEQWIQNAAKNAATSAEQWSQGTAKQVGKAHAAAPRIIPSLLISPFFQQFTASLYNLKDH